MLVLLLLCCWIGLGSLALGAKSGARGAGLWLGAGILATAQIVGEMLVLGWLTAWQRHWVIGVGVGVSALCIGLGWRELLSLWHHTQTEWRQHWRSWLRPQAVWALLLLQFGVWVWMGWLGLLLPPTDWDGLAQHLPIASLHIQSEGLARIETPYRGIHAYPANGSLLMAWTMLVAQNDLAVDLVQWPFWLLGTLALYHLAHRLGVKRSSALWGSAVFGLAPVVILQARADYVDLILAGLVLATLGLLADEHLPVRQTAPLIGSAIGLILGLKYAGMIYAALLVGVSLWRIWDERLPWRSALLTLGGLGLLSAVLGGFWYWRNWLDLANPVWPITVALGPFVWQGVWTTATFYENALPESLSNLSYPLQLWRVWSEPTLAYAPDMRLGGLGPLWPAIGLPALAVWLINTLRQPQRWPMRLMGFALVAFVMTPANWHTRYIITSIALGSLSLAMVLDRVSRWPRLTLSALTFALGCYGVGLAVFHGPVTSADVQRFAWLPAVERRPTFMEAGVATQPAMRWFDQNVPDTARIAYSWNGVVLYPFQGLRARRPALYVPPTDAPEWYDALQKAEVTFLITRPESAENQAAALDARFRLIYADSSYLIYALHP